MTKKPGLSSVITIASIIAFLIFLLIFNLTLDFQKPGDYPEGVVYEKAKVLSIERDTLQPDPDYPAISIGRQNLVLEIISGKYTGKTVKTFNLVERLINNPARIGTEYIISSYDNFTTAMIVDYNRESTVYILAAAFIAVVVFFGRRKGAHSLLSLAFTMVCIIFFFIPLIIKGIEPIAASIAVVVLSTLVTLWMLNGWSPKTIAAAAGCVSCTLLAGLIAFLAGLFSRITTMNTPEAEDLIFVAQRTNLSFHHLIFAGILFASLGAIMDTSMSISSSIFEMKEIDSSLTQSRLFRSGMNIGRDVMGTMTDTLILAFTGSSINTIVIFYMYSLPYMKLINMQLFVVEIIRGLSSSIAVVLSIPATALIASFISSAKNQNKARPAKAKAR